LSKSEIVSITYKDGSDITFVSDKQKRNLKKYGKNMVHFHMFDFVYSNLKISYERIISDGKMGIEIPLSIGYKDNTTSIPFPEPFFDSEYTNKLVTKFYSGINFNAYPTGQGKVKYFLGPALHIGDGLYHPDADSYGSNVKDAISTGFIKLLLNNGIVFSPVNNFSFSFIASLGIQYMTDPQIKKAETTGGLSINLSLRF